VVIDVRLWLSHAHERIEIVAENTNGRAASHAGGRTLVVHCKIMRCLARFTSRQLLAARHSINRKIMAYGSRKSLFKGFKTTRVSRLRRSANGRAKRARNVFEYGTVSGGRNIRHDMP